MPLQREYDVIVNRVNRATVAGLGLALVGLLSASSAWAQVHAAPPSVTSMGFGGRAINGSRPSVTSLGPRGYTPRSSSGSGSHGPYHRPRYPQGSVGYYGAPYYGYYDNGYSDDGTNPQNYAAEAQYAEAQYEDQYNDGSAPGYVSLPPDANTQAELNSALPEATPGPATPTVLVFKDGHQLEVENYAIVGTTLYDLTEGHRRKVSLGDLDLTATSQQNDDRGIDFNIPEGTVGN
jgi:hypothetical protein